MIILQLPQGHAREALTGLTLSEARGRLQAWDEAFLEKFPHIRRAGTHRPSWFEVHVPVTARAPWGTEWYAVGDDGRLYLHSADYDSSG